MKQILKLMRYDLLTVLGASKVLMIIEAAVLVPMGLFPPLTAVFIILPVALMQTILGDTDEKTGSRIFGVLPVKKKNIYRSRAYLYYAALTAGQLFAYLIVVISFKINLNRYIPLNDDLKESLTDMEEQGNCMWIMSVFVLFCVLTVIVISGHLVGMAFGKKAASTLKVVALMTPALAGLVFVILSAADLIPVIELTFLKLPAGNIDAGHIIKCIAGNIILFALTAIFTELTAEKLKDRDL